MKRDRKDAWIKSRQCWKSGDLLLNKHCHSVRVKEIFISAHMHPEIIDSHKQVAPILKHILKIIGDSLMFVNVLNRLSFFLLHFLFFTIRKSNP